MKDDHNPHGPHDKQRPSDVMSGIPKHPGQRKKMKTYDDCDSRNDVFPEMENVQEDNHSRDSNPLNGIDYSERMLYVPFQFRIDFSFGCLCYSSQEPNRRNYQQRKNDYQSRATHDVEPVCGC